MSKFSYKAKKANGEIYTGEMDAKDRYELYHILRETGADVISVKENKHGSFRGKLSFGSGTRVKTEDKIAMARNLGAMLEAGLPLSRAINVLQRQTKIKALKKIYAEISSQIDRGVTFSRALESYDKIFPPLFVSMVHAGEQGGNLAATLKTIASQMENSYNLERRVRGAMIYPGVIFSVMILIGVLMFIFVVPTLMKTFTELNVPLPPTTQFIMTMSNLISHNGIAVLSVLIILFLAIYSWSKKASGKYFLHGLWYRLPLVGELVREVNAARTARTLASLMGSGVGVVESLDITASVVQNVHFRAVLLNAREAIKKGELMSHIFAEKENLFPVFLAEMMSVGEETGKVVDMLSGVAHFYEEDVDQRTKNMSTIIEPVLMVIIGAAVGFFAIAMISPMYSLVNAV